VTPQVLIPFYVFDLSAAAAGALFAIGVFLQFWQHANVDVDTRLLEWVVVTPRYHRIHHAFDGVEPRNLANVFTWWDRLLGTYADPAAYGEGYAVGTADQKSPARMMLGV
jgi:sterol desaturase/sphingolipid hydroxylase (fatty acid hydroxylase superfamily)